MLKIILSRTAIPAWLILLAGMLATVFVTVQVKQNIEHEATVQFAFSCDQVTLKIKERLNAYALILRGAAARFSGPVNTVTRQEWQAYVDTLRVQDSIPGVQGIGFAQVIPPNQLASHIALIRAEGFPEYTVRPAGERATLTSIIYLEPFRDRNLRAFGYDMYSDPVRRAAMELARDTGNAALSGKVELVQETGTDTQPGTLMYVPVYRDNMPTQTIEQKRSSLIGWTYSPYRMNDLMSGILRDWETHEGKGIELRIYEGEKAIPAALIYNNNPHHQPSADSLLHQERTIVLNGNKWLLEFENGTSTFSISYVGAWVTLFGGLTICGLLFGLMLSVINTRTIASSIASKLIVEEGKFLALFEMSPVGVAYHEMIYDDFGKAIDYRFLITNESFLELTGVDPQGKTVRQLFPGIENDPFDWIGTYAKVISTGEPTRFEHYLQTNDRWYDCVAFPSRPGQFVVVFMDISKHKKAEQDLINNKKLLDRVIAGSDLGYWDWNLQTNTFVVSDRFVTMLGYKPGELDLSLDKWANVVHADDLRTAMNLIELHKSGKIPIYESELRCRKKSGEWAWIQTRGCVVERTQNGHPLIMSGTHTDITEKKLVELALEENEKRYSVLFSENVMPMLLISSIDGMILDANHRTSIYYGWSIDTLRTMNISDINTLELESLRSKWEEVSHSKVNRLYFQHRRADGEVRDVEVTAGPIIIGDKNLILSSINDITDRKNAEQALRNSEAFNQSVINSLTEHIAVIDSKGNISSVNHSWLKFAQENGASGEIKDWLGVNYLEVCSTSCNHESSSTAEAAQAGIRKVLSGEVDHYLLEYACDSKNDKRWFIMHVTPLISAGTGAVIAHENITLRKLYENEILDSRARLEEVTSKVIEAQEHERKNLARELHDDFGQGFAMLNINLHQLRQFLDNTSAEGFLESASDNVSSLISKMRNISGQLRPPTLDYLGLEAAIAQLLNKHFVNTQITCVFDYAGLPKKLSENTEISVYRIIQESITNIVRHANASHVIVEVNGGENAEEIEIVVRDNGIGFDTAHLFASGESILSYGLLGMSERTKLMGGRFDIESIIGSGTRITAVLPLKK